MQKRVVKFFLMGVRAFRTVKHNMGFRTSGPQIICEIKKYTERTPVAPRDDEDAAAGCTYSCKLSHKPVGDSMLLSVQNYTYPRLHIFLRLVVRWTGKIALDNGERRWIMMKL